MAEEELKLASSMPIRKNISLRLRADAEAQKRRDNAEAQQEIDDEPKEDVLSKLRTFINTEPKHKGNVLSWKHKVNLQGKKVADPFIYCCEQCDLPILVYGRNIPCKHVFCLSCAQSAKDKLCKRCKDKVLRVEAVCLGKVFVCTHNSAKHSVHGCRRSYLSQRDLHAHITHRHSLKSSVEDPTKSASATQLLPSTGQQTTTISNPLNLPASYNFLAPASSAQQIQTVGGRGNNLITIPIQDDSRQTVRPEFGMPPVAKFRSQRPFTPAFPPRSPLLEHPRRGGPRPPRFY